MPRQYRPAVPKVPSVPSGGSERSERGGFILADAADILAALPQTQCTRCAYPDCAAYATAIAQDQAPINQCPPGGAEGIRRLAAITGQAVMELNLVNGLESPRAVAIIDEDWCIGCTLCIAVCPTDAIVGGNKRMHTVMEAYCTGCELCIPVCPVDCIQLENVSGHASGWNAWSSPLAEQARARYAFHSYRCNLDAGESRLRLEKIAPHKPADPSVDSSSASTDPSNSKRSVIDAAMKRARARRAQP